MIASPEPIISTLDISGLLKEESIIEIKKAIFAIILNYPYSSIVCPVLQELQLILVLCIISHKPITFQSLRNTAFPFPLLLQIVAPDFESSEVCHPKEVPASQFL